LTTAARLGSADAEPAAAGAAAGAAALVAGLGAGLVVPAGAAAGSFLGPDDPPSSAIDDGATTDAVCSGGAVLAGCCATAESTELQMTKATAVAGFHLLILIRPRNSGVLLQVHVITENIGSRRHT
jgi:hypothetical protein